MRPDLRIQNALASIAAMRQAAMAAGVQCASRPVSERLSELTPASVPSAITQFVSGEAQGLALDSATGCAWARSGTGSNSIAR